MKSSSPGGWSYMYLTRERPNPGELMNVLTRMMNFQIIAVPGAVREVSKAIKRQAFTNVNCKAPHLQKTVIQPDSA